MEVPRYIDCARKTGNIHIRFRQDGNNITKVVTQSRYKSLKGIRLACDRWRRKNDAHDFEIAIEYEHFSLRGIGGGFLFKIASVYVDSRWENYFV
jgi:hypothetical protein